MNFSELKDLDLKNLDLKDLGSLPVPVKLIGIGLLCIAILGAGYWYVVQPKIDELHEAERKEEDLRKDFLVKKAQAINLPAYKQQMEDMQKTFGTLLRQLPNTSEVPDLLVDITQAGLGRGLQFVLFKPDRERPIDFYAELPINITVTGSYHELGLFVSDLAALPRIVTVENINITGNDKGVLTMSALAKTYRYLEAK